MNALPSLAARPNRSGMMVRSSRRWYWLMESALCSSAMTDRGHGNGKRFAALRTFLKLFRGPAHRGRQPAASTHHALAVFPIRLAQFALEDFSGAGQRQRGLRHLDTARAFVACDQRLAE